MNKYVDNNSLYSDKPSINGKQSSGNPAIYTAYAKRLGLELSISKIDSFFTKCFKEYRVDGSWGYEISRYPNETSSKGSRDEVIGWYSLGLINYETISKYNYRYNYQWIKRPWWKVLKALIYVTGEHRNYAQYHNIEDVYPLMFWLPHADQYYINKMANKPSKPLHLCMFQAYALSTILQKNISAKNILTLQLEDLNSRFWIRFINKKANYLEYFSSDHPFNTKLK